MGVETLDTSLEVSRSVYYQTVNKTLLAVVLTLVVGPEARGQQRLPIIDMHLHAYGAAEWNSQPPNPVTGKPAPATAEEHMRACLELMDLYNIVLATVSGPLEAVEAWRAASATRVWASPLFGRPGFDYYDRPLPGLESLRTMYRERKLRAMAEITAQYEGLSASDPSLEPYFALAEQLDVPVGIHTGTSFPGTPIQENRSSVWRSVIRSCLRTCWYATRSCACTSHTVVHRGRAKRSN